MIRKTALCCFFLWTSTTLASGHGPDVEFALEGGVLTAFIPQTGWGISSDALFIDASRAPVAVVTGADEFVDARSAQRSFVVPASEFRPFGGSIARFVAVEVVIEMYVGAADSIRPLAAIDRAYFSCIADECTQIDWSDYALGTGYAELITLADGTVIFNLPGKIE